MRSRWVNGWTRQDRALTASQRINWARRPRCSSYAGGIRPFRKSARGILFFSVGVSGPVKMGRVIGCTLMGASHPLGVARCGYELVVLDDNSCDEYVSTMSMPGESEFFNINDRPMVSGLSFICFQSEARVYSATAMRSGHVVEINRSVHTCACQVRSVGHKIPIVRVALFGQGRYMEHGSLVANTSRDFLGALGSIVFSMRPHVSVEVVGILSCRFTNFVCGLRHVQDGHTCFPRTPFVLAISGSLAETNRRASWITGQGAGQNNLAVDKNGHPAPNLHVQ